MYVMSGEPLTRRMRRTMMKTGMRGNMDWLNVKGSSGRRSMAMKRDLVGMRGVRILRGVEGA